MSWGEGLTLVVACMILVFKVFDYLTDREYKRSNWAQNRRTLTTLDNIEELLIAIRARSESVEDQHRLTQDVTEKLSKKVDDMDSNSTPGLKTVQHIEEVKQKVDEVKEAVAVLPDQVVEKTVKIIKRNSDHD